MDHIEGKVDAATRTGGRKDSDDEGGPPVSRAGGITGKSGDVDGDDGKSAKKSASKKDYESVGSRKLESAGG